MECELPSWSPSHGNDRDGWSSFLLFFFEGREKGGEQGDGMGLSLVNRGKPAEGWVASDRTRERERKTQKGEREDVHTLPLVVAGLQYQLLRDAQGFLRFRGSLEGSEAREIGGEEREGEE